jgi:ATP-GRASP peptide maturase of grasp-with-spasm system
MILILSEIDDASTVHVIHWLKFWSIPYKRIDKEDRFNISRFEINQDGSVCITLVNQFNKTIELNQIKANWYRRGDLNFSEIKLESISDKYIKHSIHNYLKDEFQKIKEFIYLYLASIPHIGTVATRDLNKLHVLSLAASVGLRIPETRVINSKSQLSNLPQITKAISDGFYIYINNNKYMTFTNSINISNIPDHFFPSLIQNEIIKEADIRIFFLKNECYSMAIMSQANPQSMTDFRKYPSKLRNRSIPFDLPLTIKHKLIKLMGIIKLNTGSIDMVLTKTGEFYFLEVNPVGQYDMVSVPCNYFLD